MSAIVELADAIVARLNSVQFSRPFTAARHYRPLFDLNDLETLQVSVVPKGMTFALESRSSVSVDLALDVGVQKRIDPERQEEIDELVNLVEELGEVLKRDVDSPAAVWLSLANEPIYAPDHLADRRVFTSVLTVKYRVWR